MTAEQARLKQLEREKQRLARLYRERTVQSLSSIAVACFSGRHR